MLATQYMFLCVWQNFMLYMVVLSPSLSNGPRYVVNCQWWLAEVVVMMMILPVIVLKL